MNHRIISDISNFIFVADKPEKVDAIFLPGGSHPEQPEYAAELYHQGYAKWLIPSGGINVKRDKWPGVRRLCYSYDIVRSGGQFGMTIGDMVMANEDDDIGRK